MMTRNIKNLCLLIGFITTLICVSTTPYMIKWYLALFIMYLVALWLSEEQHNDEP